MSVSPHRVWLFRARGVLAYTAILTLGACHHAPSPAPQPKVVDRRFAGVDVVPTRSGGFLIRVHSGMVGEGEPLYVIDGAPLSIPPNRGIDWIKLEDVVDIKVLTRPHELAVYGPKGVNGVIVITTTAARRSPRR
jgi:hypothetical protein